jgi:hypothetical protein
VYRTPLNQYVVAYSRDGLSKYVPQDTTSIDVTMAERSKACMAILSHAAIWSTQFKIS